MRVLAGAGAGFLLAVLWFDLMFDVQARGHGSEIPADVRASIAAYYARVTTAARPMNRLVAAAMSSTIVALVVEVAQNDYPRRRAAFSLVLVLGAVGLAASRTVPNAVRLGRQADPAPRQSQLVRMILAEHIVCFTAIGAVLVLQLAPV
jgi:hypothetical protein